MALKILNRCFTFQIESMVLNQTEDLIAQVLKENEMNVTVRDFAAEPEYTMAVSDRLNEELRIAHAVKEVSQLNFELLY